MPRAYVNPSIQALQNAVQAGLGIRRSGLGKGSPDGIICCETSIENVKTLCRLLGQAE